MRSRTSMASTASCIFTSPRASLRAAVVTANSCSAGAKRATASTSRTRVIALCGCPRSLSTPQVSFHRHHKHMTREEAIQAPRRESSVEPTNG